MAGITPFPEIMRLSLLGNYERMSAQRAHQIGMVSEVVPGADLAARAREIAAIIASQPRLAIEGTVRRNLVDALDAPTRGRPAGLRIRRHGNEPGVDQRGTEDVLVRQTRGVEPALMAGTGKVAIVGAALSDIGRVDTKTPFELQLSGRLARDRRRRAHEGRYRRLRIERHGHARPYRDRRVHRAAAHVGRRYRCRRLDLGVHGRARDRGDPRRARGGGRARVRFDHARRPQGAPPHREPGLRRPGADPVRRAVRPHAHLEVRHGDAPAHARIRHHRRATRRDRGQHALQRLVQPRGLLPRPDHHRRGQRESDDGRSPHQAPLLHPQRRRRRGRAHHRGAGAATSRRNPCGCWERARRRAIRR